MRAALAALCLLTACPDRSLSTVPNNNTRVATKTIPVSDDIDILFVVDNSLSTADKQALFAQNFPNFVNVLDTKFGATRPNVHVAVVSTTVGTGSVVDLGPSCPKVAVHDDGAFHFAMLGGQTGIVNGVACSGCSLDAGDTFLSDLQTPTGRMTNYSCPSANPLATALPCMAEIGTTGCGFEAPLDAMKRALDGSQHGNTGFLRPGAYLAVVILTDEDDCSVKDPALFSLDDVGPGDFRCQPLWAYECDEAISATTAGTYDGCVPRAGSDSPYLRDASAYYDFLATLKDPSQLVVAVIAGTNQDGTPPDPTGYQISTGPLQIPGQTVEQQLALEPSCNATVNGELAIARPGLRLASFVGQFGDRGKMYSVCQSDYSPALADFGTRLSEAIKPCLEGNIDPTQCTVSYIYDYGTSSAMEQPLPACTPASTVACWQIETNTTECADPTLFPTHSELQILNSSPPAGTVTTVSCAVTGP
ncbi:MAG TPA: hypothetical protein VGF94_26530 [Kofleriaceae bacterium]|jgi:hypothetical protein